MRSTRIIGIDINPESKAYESKDIEIFIGDQSDPNFWTSFKKKVGPIDVVLDDGGHTCNQQIQTFLSLYGDISNKGIYFVEDTHTNYWKRFQDRSDKQTFLGFAKRMTDYVNEWHFSEENWDKFAVDPKERKDSADVSSFCRSTLGVHFYDSIVVFEKAERTDPWHQIR